MAHNMSFSMTIEQIDEETKDVTRRNGWLTLKPGDTLWAVEKAMCLKFGEKVKRLKRIRVVSTRRESVNVITLDDVRREGFPGKSCAWFIDLYCKANKCGPRDLCTRIEFEYLEDEI